MSDDVPEPTDVTCRLLRFNPRRAARGVGAASVELAGQVLWMTKRDIALNIRDWGQLPGLLAAEEAYAANVPFPPEQFVNA